MSRKLYGPASALSMAAALVASLCPPAVAQQPVAQQQVARQQQTDRLHIDRQQDTQLQMPPIIHKLQSANERLEMTVNDSRMLTLDQKIPRAQVNNPDLLDLTPIGPKQLQIHAKKIGVTQVNLWDEQNKVYSIDVVILGDVRQLSMLLKSQFRTSSLRVQPSGNSVILSGFVDRSDYVSRIVQIAQDFYPKVINNMTVGGAQQVLLHVKVMEVNRTKLRDMGFDFQDITSSGSFIRSSVSGLLRNNGTFTSAAGTGQDTIAFGIVDANNSFFGLLSALQKNSLASVIAEPTLVTISGRPASFQSGGQIPVPIPQSLGTVTIEYRDFGTQVDFVPIVLGNGNIRLEVRPKVSEIDPSIGVTLNGSTIPGFKTRQVETGVEMHVGQTLALAGLIQNKVATDKRGIPWIMDVPYLGVPFRRMQNTVNEVELLIMVRPELVEALDCDEVPPYGPGENSRVPTDYEMYILGHTEVPAFIPPKGHLYKNHGQGANDGSFIGPNGEQQQMIPQAPANGRYEEVQPAPAAENAPAPMSSKTRPRAQVAQANPTTGNIVEQRRPSASKVVAPAAGQQNRSNRVIAPQRQAPAATNDDSVPPGFIGPIGYDVVN